MNCQIGSGGSGTGLVSCAAAGVGHFFKGQFVENATPGINPRYFYIAQQYVLK
ncbi:MAG TPA: hypothetical protein VF392_10745 [Terracidiphilus sp.]